MENIYRQLQRKLNTLGPGFPETDEGYELNYLALWYTEEQANFAVKMPLGLHSAQEIADDMEISLEESMRMLNELAKGNLVIRVHDNGEEKFYLLPSMHGFIDFNTNGFTPEVIKNFAKHFANGLGARIFDNEIPVFRILPTGAEVVEEGDLLPCDDVEAIIRKQEKIVRLPCICRKVASNRKTCKNNPETMEMCLAFGTFADFYLEHGIGEEIAADEAVSHMRRCDAEGNTIEILNTRNVEIMCSCCGCCCTVLAAAGKFGGKSMKYASNYVLDYNVNKCVNCGTCVSRCNLRAFKMVDGKVVLNAHKCLGCGLCVTTCPEKAIKLFRKPVAELYEPPKDNFMELYDYQRQIRRKEGSF